MNIKIAMTLMAIPWADALQVKIGWIFALAVLAFVSGLSILGKRFTYQGGGYNDDLGGDDLPPYARADFDKWQIEIRSITSAASTQSYIDWNKRIGENDLFSLFACDSGQDTPEGELFLGGAFSDPFLFEGDGSVVSAVQEKFTFIMVLMQISPKDARRYRIKFRDRIPLPSQPQLYVSRFDIYKVDVDGD